MIKVDSTKQFDRSLAKLCVKKPKIAFLLVNALKLLTQSEFSSNTLKVHKLNGTLKECYAFSIAHDLRVIFIKESDKIVLVNIGSHDEVY